MDKATQRQMVFLHLQQWDITSMEAFERYGATRLSAIIFDLRKQGHNIVTIMEEGVNRYGDKTHYARYHLIKE